MPAPPLSNNFEGGISGNSIVATTAGSGDAWSSVSGAAPAPQYTNAQKHRGALSMQMVEPVTSGIAYVRWSALGSLTGSVYCRCYIYLPALPNVNTRFLLVHNNAGTVSAGIYITTTGLIRPINAAGAAINTGVKVVPINQWFRLEWRVKSSATVGESEWKLFSSVAPGDGADGITPTETINAAATQVLASDTDLFSFGVTATGMTSQTVYMDDISVSTNGFIGPALALPQPRRVFQAINRSNTY